MEQILLKIGMIAINQIIERVQQDPIAAQKVQNGEPLDEEDFARLGSDRNDAIDELDEALSE